MRSGLHDRSSATVTACATALIPRWSITHALSPLVRPL